NTPAVGTGTWTIQSGTGGILGDASDPASSFSGVAGTSYTLRWRITNPPCPASNNNVIIAFDETPTLVRSKSNISSCGSGTDGIITGFATGGSSPHEFSLNGGAFQTATGSNPDNFSFTGLAPGTYSLQARTA